MPPKEYQQPMTTREELVAEFLFARFNHSDFRWDEILEYEKDGWRTDAKEALRLTASPGEQEPVAHRIRVVDGSYCKVIPDGELEIWKQNWSTHLKSGHALLEPLYLSPPPAAGQTERELAAQAALARVRKVRDGYANQAKFADVDQASYFREFVRRLDDAVNPKPGAPPWNGAALRREAPAPEGVVKIGGTALCGHGVMAAICEVCNRPDAGGGVRQQRSSMAAQWTYDPEAEAYYFAPMTAAPGPYLKQRHVDAIIDIASDGTLAGVELIDNMPPPPVKALSAVGDEAKKSALSFKAAQNTAESDPSVTPDCLGADTGGRDSSSLPSGESDLSVTTGYLPPDPTAERRENARSPMQRLLDAAGWDAGSTRHKQLEDALDGARLRIVAAEGSADRREIVARIKADPGDGTLHPDLAHVLARGFDTMGWDRPASAAEDMIDAILAALDGGAGE